MVAILLDGISNILSVATGHGASETVSEMIEECNGLDKLEELQVQNNEHLRKKACDIIETFFSYEDGLVRVSASFASKVNVKVFFLGFLQRSYLE